MPFTRRAISSTSTGHGHVRLAMTRIPPLSSPAACPLFEVIWVLAPAPRRATPSQRSRRRSSYRCAMSSQRVPGGVVHKLPTDLRKALIGNSSALDAWKDITPLARNEFICWVEDAKQDKTRERRIRRTQEELEDGMRRRCCWPGCSHRERNGR